MRKGLVILAFLAAVPGFAALPARPGTVNYLEGKASIGSQDLGSKAVGQVSLEPGQTLQTDSGHAEVLLTPGAYLRLNSDSAVRMISPGLTGTKVELLRGQAMLEVDDLHKENNLQVAGNGALTTIAKNGLYRFDADRRLVAVYDGKAEVQYDDRTTDVKGGRAVSLADGATLKAEKFDKKNAEDELYNWSKLRSGYLAEANAASARVYVSANSGWAGPGWYWNPWYSAYTFIPGSGVLYSPFGWGFASPWASPYWGGWYGPHYRAPIIVRRGPVIRRPVPGVGGFHGTMRSPGVVRPGINPGMGARGGARYVGPRGH